MTFLYLVALAGDGGVAFGPDGGGLGGAAADRQFRLGRYHLDLFGRACRRGRRAVAGRRRTRRTRGNGWSRRWSRSGRCGSAAHVAHPQRGRSRDDPRYAAFAEEWGADAPRRMFMFLQNQALGLGPAGIRDLRRRACSASRRCALQDYLGALDPACRHRRRSAGGCAAQSVPETIRPTRARSATSDCGAGRAIPNYFFEWFGWLAYPVIAISPTIRFAIPGASRRCWRRSSCTGSWCMSPASRRWNSRCCVRVASAIGRTSRAPAPSFQDRLGNRYDERLPSAARSAAFGFGVAARAND